MKIEFVDEAGIIHLEWAELHGTAAESLDIEAIETQAL